MDGPWACRGSSRRRPRDGQSRKLGPTLKRIAKGRGSGPSYGPPPLNNYQSSSVSCRACPHLRGRLWPWPQPRSCMRRLWLCRSTWYLGSDRHWWTCLTRPGQDHHQELELSRSVLLFWSWVRERAGAEGAAAAAGAAGAAARCCSGGGGRSTRRRVPGLHAFVAAARAALARACPVGPVIAQPGSTSGGPCRGLCHACLRSNHCGYSQRGNR